MVEFVRDVMIALAALATLIAFALPQAAEPDATRHGATVGAAVAATITPAGSVKPARTAAQPEPAKQ